MRAVFHRVPSISTLRRVAFHDTEHLLPKGATPASVILTSNRLMQKDNATKILMISYYYPPLLDVGCRRSVAFSKYLQRFGYNTYVLSVKNPDKFYTSIGNAVAPENVTVFYSRSLFNLSRLLGKINAASTRVLGLFGVYLKKAPVYDFLSIPDIFWPWIPLTFFKALRIIREYDIDVIYVSCPPFTSAIIGALLKNLTRKTLVIDFRDTLAIQHPLLRSTLHATAFRRKSDACLLSFVLKHSDLFITVTEESRRTYSNLFPSMADKFYTVHNGIDTKYHSQSRSYEKYRKFTIVYIGEFYFYALEAHSFFEALSLLKKSKRISQENFRFLFFGENADIIRKISTDHGVDDLVAARGRIPREQVLDIVSKSHLQLLRVVPMAIPTKLYEGIVLNIPFIAPIHEGEAANIIRKFAPASYVVTDDSPQNIGNAILQAMEDTSSKTCQENDVNAFLQCFSREILTKKLSSIISHTLHKCSTDF